MGDEQVTEECLEVIRVDSERNLLLIKGAIPGSKSGFVKVIFSAKRDKINSDISKQIQEQKDAQLAQEQEAKAAEEAEKAAAKEAKNVTSENDTKDNGEQAPEAETE
jgi:Ribosomal protein L3